MEKLMLIYNPKSGRQNFESKLTQIIKKIEPKFKEIYVFMTEYPNHASELCEKACVDHYDMVIIVGGDGTFNECVNGLMKHKERPVIGYLPAGTCCDIGMSLGLSKNLFKSLEIILTGVPVKMDIVKTNDRYSCYVTATGAFIDISYVTDSKLKKKIGYFAYIVKAFEEIFTIPKMDMTIHHDNEVCKGVYTLVLIINSKRVAGVNMIYKPSLDDGLVNVVLYKNVFPFNFILFALSFIFPFWSTPLVKRFKTNRMEIKTSSKAAWNVDGEFGGSGNQIIEVSNQAIDVIVPEKIKKRYFTNQ
ncbi:MAG: diacylglycerol kinase family lipid kinase [Candidatus Izemoplasmatales bacterium]|nr:diacylglycerol kinase family lipid kinase [Candidatus Izemoplasmatales bacterium]